MAILLVFHMLKDKLFKTSGLQFYVWLLGSERFSGLSRDRPQAPVVQNVDSAIQRKNDYPMDRYSQNLLSYQVNSDYRLLVVPF